MKDSTQQKTIKTKEELDNTSQQLNPNNEKFWKSRDYKKRPDNWKEIIKVENHQK